MPRIFDNIETSLLPALAETLQLAYRADFCVGYFNLRGWKALDAGIDPWLGGPGSCCRLLVGMQRLPEEDLRALFGATPDQDPLDHSTALRLRKQLAEEFRTQLTIGIPNNADEAGLRRLAGQLRTGKLVVKLFLRHPLHAKLYLLFRHDPINPIVGYLGSSNLTLAGLSHQGELNVDVLDGDASQKLARWFEERWTDRWCVDITAELMAVIEQSWAREEPLLPYHIYIKMAYHLAQEARAGLAEFRIPPEFGHRLFDYQTAAVKIAAHHLNQRGGVLIGDVVGLGKTLMATALAKIFQDDHFTETLILCPKNLVKMWEDSVARYRLLAKVLSVTRTIQELPNLRRYRVVLIDESHNLRNREGQRYLAIRDYVRKNESQCILLSATPYNKTYADLSNQFRLFVPEDGLWHSPGPAVAGAGGDRVQPSPSVPAPVAGRLREEPSCGRLARADAAVPGAPHARFHPGQLRHAGPGDRAEIPYLRGRQPFLLPGTPAQDGPVPDRRAQPRRSIRPLLRARYRGRHQRAEPAALWSGQLRRRPPAPAAHPRRSQGLGRAVPRGQAADPVPQ